jgi:antirestriction protein ArdC
MPKDSWDFYVQLGIIRVSALCSLCRYRHYCHASGAKHRLDRDLSGRFGSASYALEEISVEILSGMILADLGIAHHPRPDHAAYVASWLRVLKDNPRAIFTAASKAQQAADWMHARQPMPLDEAA